MNQGLYVCVQKEFTGQLGAFGAGAGHRAAASDRTVPHSL